MDLGFERRTKSVGNWPFTLASVAVASVDAEKSCKISLICLAPFLAPKGDVA